MKKVEKAGIKGIKRKRKPYQISSEDFFNEKETIRMLFSQLIDVSEPKRVSIIPSASYGIANVVNNLPFTSGKIILAAEQFPSNVYPWQTLASKGFKIEMIEAPASQSRSEAWNEKILEAIDEKTKVVAIGHVHWSDGTLFKLKEIRKKLDKVGGLLIIDGTQSVGALPFSVSEFRPDALICAGYKWLMGPYSISLAYYGEVFDNGNPIEHNWMNRKNSNDFAGLVNYEDSFREMAMRHDAGEYSNFILVPMLHAALKQLLAWTPIEIQNYTHSLMKNAIEELTSMGYQIEKTSGRANHLFGIRWNKDLNLDLEKLKASIHRNRVSLSFRGNTLRVAPHVYNDEMDVRKLLKALKAPIFA